MQCVLRSIAPLPFFSLGTIEGPALESTKNVADLEGADGVAADGVLWRGEDGVDESCGLAQVLALLDGTHRFCNKNL